MGCLTILALIALLFGGVQLSSIDLLQPASPGFTTVTFSAANASSVQLQAAASVIETRLDILGIRDATITLPNEGADGVLLVRLPSVDDPGHLFSLLAAPGYLELVDFSDLRDWNSDDIVLWTTGREERLGSPVPDGVTLNPLTDAPFETVIDGTMVTEAFPVLDQYGQWTIQVRFDEVGAARLGSFTAAHIGEPLAIVLDGRVLSAPVVQAEVSSEAVIAGGFTEQQARELAVQIGSGPLPISLECPICT